MEFVPGYRAANAPRRTPPKPEAPTDPPRGNTKDRKTGPKTDTTETPGSPGHLGRSTDAQRPTIAAPQGGTEKAGGNGHGHASDRLAGPGAAPEGQPKIAAALTTAMRELQADAPACEVCGTITVRNGTCYKCLNCGHSMGCS